jgi:hypothetical protein
MLLVDCVFGLFSLAALSRLSAPAVPGQVRTGEPFEVSAVVVDAYNNTVLGERALKDATATVSVISDTSAGRFLPSPIVSVIVNHNIGVAVFNGLLMSGLLDKVYSLEMKLTAPSLKPAILSPAPTLYLAGCGAGLKNVDNVKCEPCPTGKLIFLPRLPFS